VNRKAQRERWWQFAETRPGIIRALPNLGRVGLVGLTGKRLLLTWGETTWRPSHACGVFAFDEDYYFGICSSRVHEVWARGVSSTLEDRLRYTPSIAFESFPFPKPNKKQKDFISAAAQQVLAKRRMACDSLDAGLTKVYNTMDEGGFRELKSAHEELDLAVMDAYGFDIDLLNQPERLLDALFDLNEEAATDPNYQPFGERGSSLFDEADA